MKSRLFGASEVFCDDDTSTIFATGTVEEEWKKYKDSFVGVTEEMCGRTSGNGGRSKNEEWWTETNNSLTRR